jgi:hypothetical protein
MSRRERQIAIFQHIARHLIALVYLIAELVLGEKLPKLRGND